MGRDKQQQHVICAVVMPAPSPVRIEWKESGVGGLDQTVKDGVREWVVGDLRIRVAQGWHFAELIREGVLPGPPTPTPGVGRYNYEVTGRWGGGVRAQLHLLPV